MTTTAPTALIAEDEPALARTLQRLLAQCWPELNIAAVADNGPDATQAALELAPDLLFLDIKMPGCSGLEVAAAVADDWPEGRPEPLIVFVTAHDEFALEAFERAAADYLLKPVTPERLAASVERLRRRMAERAAVPGAGDLALLFQRIQAIAEPARSTAERLAVLRAGVGNTVRMIPVAEILCLEATDKYVNVVTATGEALVRMSLRELLSRIDASGFVQVHRAVMVREASIASATRDEIGHCHLTINGLARPVKVSRAFAHLFRPM